MASQVDDTFEIIISGTKPPYRVNATGPDVSPVLADLPGSIEWLTDDLCSILADMAAENSQARGEKIQTLGEALYRALFTRDIELLYVETRLVQPLAEMLKQRKAHLYRMIDPTFEVTVHRSGKGV
jgi:hypothetical protein